MLPHRGGQGEVSCTPRLILLVTSGVAGVARRAAACDRVARPTVFLVGDNRVALGPRRSFQSIGTGWPAGLILLQERAAACDRVARRSATVVLVEYDRVALRSFKTVMFVGAGLYD